MKKLLGTVALVGMLVAPGVIQAQTVVGPAVAYHDDAEAFGIGAYLALAVPQLHENISIAPNFIFFFPDGFDYWELNGDVTYRFPVSAESPVIPFGLAGISIARTSVDVGTISVSNTDVGLNLGGGVIFPLESVRPFAGAKFEFQDNTSFVILGGVGFTVGG